MHHPDKSGLPLPTLAELRQYWPQVHERLQEAFQQLPVREWFARHTAVSEEDFARPPYRNRLSVLLSRLRYAAYHTGQLLLLKYELPHSQALP